MPNRNLFRYFNDASTILGRTVVNGPTNHAGLTRFQKVLSLSLLVLFVSCTLSSLCEAQQFDFTTRDEAAQWYEDARFGIFVHWDPRSNIVEGSFDPDIRPETKDAQQSALFDPVDEDRLKWETWNPVNFDADQWIDLFVDSGANYFTYTTVHMHGFCNFDSPATDFDIMSTEYKRDIVEQLAKAAEGRITSMWYFGSNGGQGGVHIPKELWPDYYKGLWDGVTTYDELRAANIQHLITNTDRYGKVAGIWWDGGGDWNMNDPANRDFFKPLLEAQPWLIMSPRCGHPDHVVDWRCTEQRIGGFNMEQQWEMCVPIESSVWFWSGGKEANTKDLEHCVKLLVMCASGDGNLLLNISPMPDGRIQPLQAEILRGVGNWLDTCGESIYGTRGGPYKPGIWGGATRNGNKIFLHVLQDLQGGELILPPLPVKISEAKMLTGGTVEVQQNTDSVRIILNDEARCAPFDRIVELQIDSDAMEIDPIEVEALAALTEHAEVIASSEYSYLRPSGKRVHDSALNAIDESSGHWTAGKNDAEPWIEVDLGSSTTFQQIYLVEQHTRIREYEIQYCEGEGQDWRTVYRGGRMNYASVRLAEPVAAIKVRVRILRSEGGAPQISRIELFE